MVLDGVAFAVRRTPSGYERLPSRVRGHKQAAEAKGVKHEAASKGVKHAAGDRHGSRAKRGARHGSNESRGEADRPSLTGSDRVNHDVPDSCSAEPAIKTVEESPATARGPAGRWVHVPA